MIGNNFDILSSITIWKWWTLKHGYIAVSTITIWYAGVFYHMQCQHLQLLFFHQSNVRTIITSGTLASWYWLLSQNSTTYWSIIYSDTYIANIYYQSEDIGNEEYYASLVIPRSVCAVLERVVETTSMEITKYQVQRITWWTLNGKLG